MLYRVSKRDLPVFLSHLQPRAKYKPLHVFASGLFIALIFPPLSVRNLRPDVSHLNHLDSKYYIVVGFYKVYE